MMISEEALYAAAPEAAEKFLSALPDREDCVHDFSPDFEARMATLLRRQRRRRHWRALLAAAAVLGALAAGLSVGAGDRTDCQIYWSQTDGELAVRYPPGAAPPPGLSRTPNCAVCRRASSWSAAAPVRSAGSEVWRTEGGRMPPSP